MMKQLFLMTVIFIAGSCVKAQQEKYHQYFFEDFSSSPSVNFQLNPTSKGDDFTYRFGADSPTDPGTKLLLMKIDPEGMPGAGKGPELISDYFTHFGTYAARLKVPDVKDIQPNVGAVVGYFTYHMDSVPGLSEIDFEWLLADPEIIYIGTWTGLHGKLKRIGRTINLAKGIIYSTEYKERPGEIRNLLTGIQNQPETIPAIKDYDASSQFYTYGFNWYPDRIRWWMIRPETADTLVLWEYQGSLTGIPQNHSQYRLNFWHTNNWPVETNPNSIEKPAHPYELAVDWMLYDPLKK
jgi:hypothetical protein